MVAKVQASCQQKKLEVAESTCEKSVMLYQRVKGKTCGFLTTIILAAVSFHLGLLIGPYITPDIVAPSSLFLAKDALLATAVIHENFSTSSSENDGQVLGESRESSLNENILATKGTLGAKNGIVPFRGTEKRCIAFTLYSPGGPIHERHTEGLFLNIQLIEVLYPKWKIKLFLDEALANSSLHMRIKSTLEEMPSISIDILWKVSEGFGHFGHFWRFLVADLTDCDRWIVRDVDCRITIREMQAVHDWINSGKSFHIMRDHPGHDGEILAGLFGGTRESLKGKKMADLIYEFFQPSATGVGLDGDMQTKKGGFWSDQEFLRRVVFPIIKDDFVAHDDFSYHGACKMYGNCREFPVKDLPFITHWSNHETVVCSCKPRCLCDSAGVCPAKLVANKYKPVCYNITEL